MFKIFTKENGKIVRFDADEPDDQYVRVLNYVRTQLPKTHKTPILALFESTAKNDETPPPSFSRA